MFYTISCEDNVEYFADSSPTIFLFKEGKDYSKNVYVLLNDDKTRIIGYPSYKDLKYDTLGLLDIYKGYYFTLDMTYGVNSAYLSLTVKEFEFADDTISVEDMEKLIIDKDPYAEFYFDENKYLLNRCSECIDKDTTWPAYDTAKLHRLIDNGELSKYLNRVK
ncbi:MAG: hypothetical protein JXB17_13070 [Bacteroidales bacterium]|nr:hypothetical protein [Bacteroidales bacterium]